MKMQLDKFGEMTVKRLMQSGHWSSANKLVNDGLRVVSERHRLWNVQRQEFLGGFLHPALEEIKRGKAVAYDREILGQLRTRKPHQVRSLPSVTRPKVNYQVYLSHLALRDLRYYWKNANDLKPGSGERFFGKVDRMLESLRRKPRQGKKREELWRTLRSLGSYTLAYPWFEMFFFIKNNDVCVLRIVHWTYNPASRMSFP